MLVNQGGYVYSLNFDCWHGAVDAAIGLELNSLKVAVIEEALN
jgi:hypothetical protein